MKHVAGWLLTSLAACASPEPPAEEEPAPPAEAAPAGTTATDLEDIKRRIEEVKTRLFDEGKYNCCVKPSCVWCALHEGACDCFSNLQAGEAVCPGCGLGWHNGQGIVEGVDPSTVKWTITHEHAEGAHQH
jgi:hypothetical protein